MKPSELFTELAQDLRSPRMLPAVSIGLVMGILTVILALSFAAMIYSGPLAPLALRGAGLTLWGTLAICTVGALGSAFKSIIGIGQDAPTAVMSTVAAAVAAAMAATAPLEACFMTVAAAMLASAFASAAAFLVIGRFRLANLLRFMPYPVVGGFLAGSGWLLSVGGISVMCGVSPAPGTVQQMMTPAVAALWLPGVVYGTVLFAIMLRWSHFLILPGSLAVATVLFYVGFAVTGMSVDSAKAAGFLVSGLPADGLWPAVRLSDLSQVDWAIVWRQLPGILTVVLVTVVGMLLNMSGIELGIGGETDMNREFTIGSAGNFLAGCGGSIPGYPAISLSLLGFKTGADSRWTGLVTAAVVAAVLFVGGRVLEFFPKPLLGGLLLLLGLFFIYDWVIETRKRLPLVDYVIVVTIFLVIGIFGFMQGVAFGLVATVVFFVVRFSRVPVIASTFTAGDRRSLKQRPIPHRKILTAAGSRIIGYELTGYLFFGSAATLVASLKEDLGKLPRPEVVMIDFSSVSGFDVSAVNNFTRFAVNAASGKTMVLFTATDKRFEDALKAHLPAAALPLVVFLPDIDRGLEWCEERLIDQAMKDSATSGDSREALFDQSVDDVIAHLEQQERYEALLEHLSPWLQLREYNAGTVIMARGAPVDALYLVIAGEATETDDDAGTRLRTLLPGDVAAAGAAFGIATAQSTITAADTFQAALLTKDARELLEKETPALAAALHGYVIQKLAG
ncbi:MAG: SulP family inorganic anion transporter [Pseudomonadota bacterium]